MNGGTSSLKVTVNGKKYLITGIQRETSCKGLLCAIAKVTSQEEELIRSCSQRTSETENLLERFKGDRKLAGDLTSFNVFNSLAKDAKITVKESATHVKTNRKEGLVDVPEDTLKQSSSKHHKHTKKQKHHDSSKSKETKTKESTKSKDDKTKDSDKSKSDKTKDHSKTKDDKTKEKKSKHSKRNKNKETLTTTTTTTLLTTKKTETTKVKHKIKHRSVDDSDIESYKRDNLKRFRNKRRVYDDSDVEIYKTLQNIVVDQNKKLTRIQGHSRELKKAAWVKELKRGSQIYYLDDKPTSEMVADPILVNELLPTVSDDPQTGPNSSCSYEKDDGNDSGLPSPEYDSSESQENQTISSKKIKESIPLLKSKDMNNNNNTKYELSTTNNEKEEKVEPANHFSVSNQENNGKLEQLNVDNLQNINHSVKASNNGQSCNSISESISVISTNGLKSETFINNTNHVNTKVRREIEEATDDNNKNALQKHEETHGLKDSLGVLNEKEVLSPVEVKEQQGGEKHMSTTKTNNKNKEEENSTSKLFNHSSLLFEANEEEGEREKEEGTMMIDKNKNILKDSEICEREVSKMVAFNEALFKGSNNTNNNTSSSNGIGKKLEKKKFKKCDISDPVLLSPSTLKKHHNVKKVQSVLGKKAADLLRQDVVKSAINSLPPSTTANKEDTKTTTTTTKEKEKYFNKKLKEIRSRASSKKNKKAKNKSEPEYFSKKQFVEDSSSSTSIITTTSTNNSENIKSKLETNENQLTVVATSSISDKIDGASKSSRSEKTNNTELLPESSITPDTTSTSSVEQTSDMLDTSLNSEGELSDNDVLKADEILNEILEYERNIKNELDQIIQCDSNTTTTTTTTKDIENEQSSQTSKVPPSYERTLQQQQTKGDDEEQQDFELIEKYLEEKQALDEISQKLNEYNYMLSRLHDEIELIKLDECEPKSSGELDEEEFRINHEIENVKSLIQSVVDLTSYQRKEMSENMELLDNIDLEYRTQKANYENLRTGTWRTNSKSAPRSLIKNVKVKRKNSLMSTTGNANGQSGNGKNSSSFV